MAKGKKTGGKDIQPGEVLNPNGRPKIPDDIKEARSLNKFEVERTITKYLYCSPKELEAYANEAKRKDTDLRAIDMLIISIITTAVNRSDYKRFNFLLDRVIGRVPQKLEATIENPILEGVKAVPPNRVSSRIDELLEKRKIIDAEYTEVDE